MYEEGGFVDAVAPCHWIGPADIEIHAAKVSAVKGITSLSVVSDHRETSIGNIAVLAALQPV